MVKTPLIWAGGKTNLLPHLLPIIKEIKHTTYVELFGGGAALLLSKKKSKTEVYNDINQRLYEFWSVMKNESLSSQLISQLQSTPYSRDEFTDCLNWKIQQDLIERVREWFVVINQGFTHEENCTSWRSSKSHSVGQAWSNHTEDLWKVKERIKHVVLENSSWENVIKNYDGKDTLFYADPPYIQNLKDAAQATTYEHEMSPLAYIRLIEALSKCRGQVVLSGYDSYYHTPLNENPEWQKVTITRKAQVGNSSYTNREDRTECIWIRKTPDKWVQESLFSTETTMIS